MLRSKLAICLLTAMVWITNYSLPAAIAQDAFAKDTANTNKSLIDSTPRLTSEAALKEIDECGKYLKSIMEKYVYDSGQLLFKGKFEQSYKQHETALKLLKEAKYQTPWSRDAIKTQIHFTYESMAGLCSNANKFELAGKIYMQGFHDPTGLKYPDNAISAGECFLKANSFALAEEAFREAIATAKDSKQYWALRGLWKTLVTEGKLDTVKAGLKEAEIRVTSSTDSSLRSGLRAAMKETYEQMGDEKSAAALRDQINDRHCPKCGGLTEISFGGCVVDEYGPKWWCDKDRLAF